jgi:hypothetical protein
MALASFAIAIAIAMRQTIAQPATPNQTYICQIDISDLTAFASMRNQRFNSCPSIHFGLFA